VTLSLLYLRSILYYNRKTGEFTWLVDKARSHPKGSRAGHKNRDGYRIIGIDDTHYAAHRLAWFYVKGRWPENYVDHINGERDDNRWANLRDVTPSENARNRVFREGVGTCYHVRKKKWIAYITIRGTTHYLGYFDTQKQALIARSAAAARLDKPKKRGS
jgi:hypothetical protein